MTVWRTAETEAEDSKIVVGASAPVGSCEFALGSVYEGSMGRWCKFGGCCFRFLQLSVYASCPTRLEKLREQS